MTQFKFPKAIEVERLIVKLPKIQACFMANRLLGTKGASLSNIHASYGASFGAQYAELSQDQFCDWILAFEIHLAANASVTKSLDGGGMSIATPAVPFSNGGPPTTLGDLLREAKIKS